MLQLRAERRSVWPFSTVLPLVTALLGGLLLVGQVLSVCCAAG